MNEYEARIQRVADLAGVDYDTAEEWMYTYDWTQDGVTMPGEHEAWIESASDEEIASWIWAGQ